MLRILIADDHDIVRRGVRALLETQPNWEVCGEASDGAAALDMAMALNPDIAIIDISMPGINGITLARRLHQSRPKMELLLFTMHDDDETVSGGLAAGARGFLLKMESDDHIVDAVKALAAHRPYFSHSVSELLLDAAVHPRQKTRLESFTVRELQVAQLIAEGCSNKQIAIKLEISVKTVESHRAAAMRKAEARTAAEFVRFAIKHNLIQA